MRPVVVDIPYTREFPFPIDACYAWLTDYQEDDPQRAGAIIHGRKVLERTPERVLLEVDNTTMGARMSGQAEVRLFPKEYRWEAHGTGRGRGVLYKYQLTPLGPDRTRLEVHYTHRVKRWRTRLVMTLGRPLIRRELDTMWDGFAASMAKDLGQPVAATQ